MSSERIHSLDGLRAVSIALVMASHFTKIDSIPGGFGVTIFFVISGFIITHLLFKEYDRTGSIDLLAFYRRRFFRLFPAIVVCILGAFLIAEFVDRDWVTPLRVLASMTFLQNIHLNWIEQFSGPLGQHWSLAVEEHYYLFYPLFLLMCLTTKSSILPRILVICVAVIGVRLLYFLNLDADDAMTREIIYRSTETRIDSILYGCALAVLARYQPQPIWGILTHPTMLFVGFALLFGTKLTDNHMFVHVFKYSIRPIGVVLVIAPILFGMTGFLTGVARTILNARLMVFIGHISFSLYLWHTACFHLTRVALGGEPIWWVLMPAATGISILFAWTSYRWVEQPGIRFGGRLNDASKMEQRVC